MNEYMDTDRHRSDRFARERWGGSSVCLVLDIGYSSSTTRSCICSRRIQWTGLEGIMAFTNSIPNTLMHVSTKDSDPIPFLLTRECDGFFRIRPFSCSHPPDLISLILNTFCPPYWYIICRHSSGSNRTLEVQLGAQPSTSSY